MKRAISLDTLFLSISRSANLEPAIQIAIFVKGLRGGYMNVLTKSWLVRMRSVHTLFRNSCSMFLIYRNLFFIISLVVNIRHKYVHAQYLTNISKVLLSKAVSEYFADCHPILKHIINLYLKIKQIHIRLIYIITIPVELPDRPRL